MEAHLIERVHNPSPATFVSEFVNEGRPAIITGVVDCWPAAGRWTPEFLQQNYGEVPIKYEIWRGDADKNDPLEFHRSYTSAEKPMRDFVDLLRGLDGPSKEIYAAEFAVFDAIPELKSDIEPLDSWMGFPRLFPQKLRERIKIKPALWFGPKGSVSALHFDRANNLFAQLYGRKQWTVIAPQYREELSWPCYEFSPAFMHFSPVDVSNPSAKHRVALAKVPRQTFEISPGELLFLPATWWHFVRGLETSISLNFFWIDPLRNAADLRHYLRHYVFSFLRHKLQEKLAS